MVMVNEERTLKFFVWSCLAVQENPVQEFVPFQGHSCLVLAFQHQRFITYFNPHRVQLLFALISLLYRKFGYARELKLA